MEGKIYGDAIVWVNPQIKANREVERKTFRISPQNRFYELWKSGGRLRKNMKMKKIPLI